MLKSYFLNTIRFLLFRFINTEFFFLRLGGFQKDFFRYERYCKYISIVDVYY